jgi:flagellar hook assembly protein FlgD
LSFSYQLQQNYPNPFNPSTRIQFSVKEASFVELAVYNLIGQKVTTLVNDFTQPGSYNVSWNGKNSNGIDCPTGVYVYALRSDSGNSLSKKMLLIR